MKQIKQSIEAISSRNRWLTSVAIGAMMLPTSILAQDGGEAVLEEVVVVASYRGSLERSLDLKRDAIGFRESIVAEDIGKFPDLNLAESLQRIPGIAITRDNGEGQQVTLRGLGPQFTRVQLNGMSISSSAIGGTDQRTRGREFDFDIFPSELFNRIDVSKTPTADLEEGGIAGTMSLRAAKPFDFDGFEAAVSIQGSYNDLADSADPRLHVLVSNEYETWGWILQGAYSERSVQVEGSSSVDWTTPGTSPLDLNFPVDSNITDPADQAALESVLFPRLPRTEFQQTERERIGFAGALAFRPSDETEFGVDVLYAQLDRETFRSNLDAVFRTQSDIEVIDITTSNGALSTGTFRNVERRSESREVIDSTDVLQIAFNGSHHFSDAFSAEALVGFAESEFDNPRVTTWLFQAVDTEVTLDFTGDPRLPSITTPVDLSDASSYTTAALRIRPENIQDESFTARVDFELGDEESNLHFGLGLTEYEKDRFQSRNDRAVTLPDAGAYSRLLPVSNIASDIGNNGQFPSVYHVADVPVANTTQFLATTGEMVTAPGLSNAGVISENETWKVEESTLAAYVAGNIETELLGKELSVNAGVRLVQTDQTAAGFSNGESVSIENDYTDVLPSVSLKLGLSDDMVVRVSAAQTMTRPSLASLAPNTSVDIGNTGNGGNPKLQPFRATQIDLGWEWYFEEGGILSMGAFYKNISGFIVSEAEEIPLRDLGIPLDSLDPQGFEGVTLDTLFTVTRPVNSRDPADLTGLEFVIQKPLNGIVEGLGVIANYTYVTSEVEALSGAVAITTTLPGLSENSFNLTAYYENEKFSGRLSYNWRDEFVQSSNIRDRTGLLRTRDTAGFLDLSASYNLNDNISLTLEGINLLDTEEYTFVGRPDLFNRFIHTGPQWFFGVRANF